MQARVTMFEIDTLRTSLDDALALFRERVVPKLRQQPGCLGETVLATPEGNGLLISYWTTAQAADAAIASGFYDAQVAEFTMFLRQPPGREHYEVIHQEVSADVAAPALDKDGG